MRRAALTGVALAAMLAGCASSGHSNAAAGASTGSTSSTVTTTTIGSTVAPPAAGVPTTVSRATGIAAELLALEDLPLGWSPYVGTSGSGASSRGCLAELTGSAGRLSRAEARFRGGTQGSEYVDEVLESFRPRGASAELSRYRRDLAGCTQVSVTANGLGFTGTIAPVALARLGDDSSAYHVNLTATITSDHVTLGYGLVVARRGDTVMVLAVSSLDPSGVDQLQQQTAVAAMAKVKP